MLGMENNKDISNALNLSIIQVYETQSAVHVQLKKKRKKKEAISTDKQEVDG